VPDAGRKKNGEGDTDKENERNGWEGERKRLLPLCSFHRLQISDPHDTLPVGDISEQKFVARH